MNEARRHYLLLTVALSATAFIGFSFTYIGPMMAGDYPPASPTVHLHGWSFFLWYLLLPLQAGLIATKRVRLHRKLGMASIGLAVVMIITGLIVATVQIEAARPADGSPFWKLNGPMILGTLVVYAVFYTLAVLHRRDRDFHKRCMIVASAGALGAAVFRILMQTGMNPMLAPVAGVAACGLFVVAGIAYDRIEEGRVQPVYWWGLAAILAPAAIVFPVTLSPAGPILARALGTIGRLLSILYV